MCQRRATRVIRCSLVSMADAPSSMLKLLDRYLIREILLPFFIVLVVLSFLLEIPVVLQQGEKLIEKGVEWHIVVHVLLTLLPQALALTIPCAVLVGILVAFGRISTDREFVAMQAGGISIFRLMRPIALFSALATAATLYVTIVALPDANQSFREITFNVVASQAESDIKPRVFYTAFPNRVLYVRDQGTAGGWKAVFPAGATRPDETTVYFAAEGRLLVDRGKRTVQLALTNGTSHTTFIAKPEEYEGKAFGSLVLTMDPEAVFPRVELLKGDPEMTIAELRASAADAERRGAPRHGPPLLIHHKFALAGACAGPRLLPPALRLGHPEGGPPST